VETDIIVCCTGARAF